MGLFTSVLTGSLQGIAERPLPCNYNVIQFVCALSRRCSNKSPRVTAPKQFSATNRAPLLMISRLVPRRH